MVQIPRLAPLGGTRVEGDILMPKTWPMIALDIASIAGLGKQPRSVDQRAKAKQKLGPMFMFRSIREDLIQLP